MKKLGTVKLIDRGIETVDGVHVELSWENFDIGKIKQRILQKRIQEEEPILRERIQKEICSKYRITLSQLQKRDMMKEELTESLQKSKQLIYTEMESKTIKTLLQEENQNKVIIFEYRE